MNAHAPIVAGELADDFIDWPTDDKTHVTTENMLLFAEFIADIAASDEREACAEAIKARSTTITQMAA